MIIKTVKYFSFFILIILTLFNCMQTQDVEENVPDKTPPVGHGFICFRITGEVENSLPRTIFPQPPVFSSYLLSFTPLADQNRKDNIKIDENGIIEDVDLEAGRWLITAYGFVLFQGNEEIIAEGEVIVNVILNQNNNITITIKNKSLDGEYGMFKWSLLVPDNVTADFWTLSLSEWSNEINRVINIHEEIKNRTGEITINGSQLCKNGYYLLNVSIGTNKQQVFYFSVVHIRGHEITFFQQEVRQDEFVPVVVINGSVAISSIRINGNNLQPSSVELREVWAYSSEGEKISFSGIDNSKNWQMRIVEPLEETDLIFYVILFANGHLLEVKINNEEKIYKDDIFVNLSINSDLLELNGRLNLHTADNLSNYDWEIKAYNASSSVQLNSNEMMIKTNTTGQWKMLINAFNVPTDIYFSAEKIINSKKYKRTNLGKRSISNIDVGIITLNAYLTPPVQVWIRGNIFSNENSRIMHPLNGRYSYTRNNTITDINPNYFYILANFGSEITNPNWNQISETLVHYDYSKVKKDNVGLLLYNENNAIAWDNLSSSSHAAGQDNVRIMLDFTNDEYFDEQAMPLIKVERIDEVFITEGTFTMGSPSTETGRNGPTLISGKGMSSEVQHSVLLSSFYMMATEVSQKMYEELMPVPSYKNTDGYNFRKNDYPVVNINWLDAVEFSNKLSEKDGLTKVYTISGTGNNRSVSSVNWNASGWRLPTEAEWEYAARAGSTGAFTVFRDEADNLLNQNGQTMNSNLANYNALAAAENEYTRSPTRYIGYIVEVKSYFPNKWGLYNMHGNVWEFCWDWYGDYIIPAPTNPKGPETGTSNVSKTGPNNLINYDESVVKSQNRRIIRGGSYYTPARYLRSAHRGVIAPTDKTYNDIGFRLVRNGNSFPQ